MDETINHQKRARPLDHSRVAWMGSNREEYWHIVDHAFFWSVVHERVCSKCYGIKKGFFPSPFDVVVTEKPRAIERRPHGVFPAIYRHDLWAILGPHTRDVVIGKVWLKSGIKTTLYPEYVCAYHKPGSQMLVRAVKNTFNFMSRCDLCNDERLDWIDSHSRICRRYLDGRGVYIDSCGFFVTDETLSNAIKTQFPEIGRRWVKVVDDVDDGIVPWRDGATPPPPGTTPLNDGNSNVLGEWINTLEP